jgi:hypothetical protein
MIPNTFSSYDPLSVYLQAIDVKERKEKRKGKRKDNKP